MAKTDDPRYGAVNKQAQQREQATLGRWDAGYDNVQAQGQNERNNLINQYTRFNEQGGIDETARSRSRSYIDDGLAGLSGGGGGDFGGGGSGMPEFNSNLSGPGDYFGEAYGVFSGLGRDGGISGVDLNAVREPLEGYRNLSQTGGYTDAQKGDIRARALSPMGSIYENQRADLDRTRAVQGGYSPGFATASNQLTRQQGQDFTDMSRGVEMDIADRVRAGQLAGLEGIGSTQLNAESLNLAQQEAAQRGKLGGAQGMAGIGSQRTSRDLQMEGMNQSARASASAASAADARFRAQMEQAYRMAGVQNEQGLMDRFQQGSMYGTEGLQGLYDGQGYGPQRAMDTNMLNAAMGFGAQDIDRMMGSRGTGIDWGGIASGAAGLLAAPMTGGTSLLGTLAR